MQSSPRPFTSALRLLPAAAIALAMVIPAGFLLGGCASSKPYPRLARGYIDHNQNGIREPDEYIDPDIDLFGPSDTILIVTRLKTDRTGGNVKVVVWGPDRITVVGRETTSVRDRKQVVQFRFAARAFLQLAGPGTYLVNWRWNGDTIDSYTFELIDDGEGTAEATRNSPSPGAPTTRPISPDDIPDIPLDNPLDDILDEPSGSRSS